MNPSFQKSSTQVNETTPNSSIPRNTQKANLPLNPRKSPMNRVSILKTEEQKQIVRTNFFEPNNTSSGANSNFTVVTEVINRSSNLTFDSKPNTSNKLDINFSFNRPMENPALNTTFQNKTVNIQIVDSKPEIKNEKINSKESYQLLIKRIASQLKVKIRPPTHGFFFFALQKGDYPLMVIKKMKNQIVNHSIELNSDVFQVYCEKYMRYRELVKRIAHLLKISMKKMFWENERYTNRSIQVKVTNKNNNVINSNNINVKINTNINTNNNTVNANIKNNNSNEHGNAAMKKNVIKSSLQIQNKKVANPNVKNTQGNNMGHNNNNNQRKNNNHMNNRNNINHSSTSQSNNVSHKLAPMLNPFIAAKNQNQIQKKMNFTKKPEFTNKNNNMLNKTLKNKTVNNNNYNGKNESSRSASSETNKNAKIKFPNTGKNVNNQQIKESNVNKDEKIEIINTDINIVNNNNDTNIINGPKVTNINDTNIINGKNVTNNNDTNTNIINEQNDNNIDGDIEMKDETKNIKEEIINTTNTNDVQKTSINMKIIPHRNTATTMNNKISINEPTNATNANVENNSSIIRENNVKKITFDSIKSPGKKLEIKLSTLKKSEDVINTNINTNTNKAQNQAQINSPFPKAEIKIDIQTIDVPIDNNSITDENISFVNKFNVFLSSNGIILDYNIPVANTEEGRNCLKKNMFWEKYIHYLYNNYLIDKKNKINIFAFIHLIEQYFLWCETINTEYIKKFKELLINTINKLFGEKEISQFLSLNKMNNLEELFIKYEKFFKYVNKNKNNYSTINEIEIKIDNDEECTCELCQDDEACIKRVSEMNKKININMNTESILIKADYEPKNKIKQNEINRSYNIALEGKEKSGVFSKSKTSYSFETVYQYVPPKLDIKEKSKEKSKKKSSQKGKEKFIDVENDTKIDENVDKEEKEEREEKEEKEENSINKSNKSRSKSKNKSRSKSKSKSKSKNKSNKRNNKKNDKKQSIKDILDLINEDNKKDGEEEKEKEKEKEKKEKNKKKNKRKSKSRNKSNNRKYQESDSEEEDPSKDKNKKKKYPDSDNENEIIEDSYGKGKNKKASQYPRRKKGKK